jgi:hypothetical protein
MKRYSIRDLLWLTVTICISLGWYVDRRSTEEVRSLLIDRAWFVHNTHKDHNWYEVSIVVYSPNELEKLMDWIDADYITSKD